ncbi:MAG: hypothetical protein Tsb0013_10130 [Phycisphaerales bacterium]
MCALAGAWCGSGCTGLEPALIGAAISGTQTGVTLLAGAEVLDFREVAYEDVCAAVDRVERRFDLVRVNTVDDPEEGRYWVYFRYDGRKLTAEVRRLTGVITSLEVDTRAKDQRGMATLFVEAVVEELDAIEGERASQGDIGAG